jgi:hypothetical protein
MYVKAFQSLLDSSIWAESSDIRVVWMTMLLMANQDGIVLAAAPGIANRARVDVNTCLQALQKFQEPDPDSRTMEHEGRRIERVDGGYLILNYTKYRQLRDENQRRNYMREYMAKRREQERKQLLAPVNTCKQQLAQAEADTEAEAKRNGVVPAVAVTTLAQVSANGKKRRPEPKPFVYPPEFEQIWQEYPKKVGKLNAYREWMKVDPKPDVAVVVAAIKRLKATGRELKFYKDPERWIKGRHWEDEVETPKKSIYQNFDDPNYHMPGDPKWMTQSKLLK